jgi:U2-associated protein SR140
MFVCLRNENQRGKLRELELKVVRYQDELEAGLHHQISGMSVSEQVQQYREHLLHKVKNYYYYKIIVIV